MLPLLRRAPHVEPVRFTRQPKRAARRGVVAPLLCVMACVSGPCSRVPPVDDRMLPSRTTDAPVAEALQSRTADTGADLIVMREYDHSLAWAPVLGGVTRMLRQAMTVPELMSH